MWHRKPCVAGSFYPSNKNDLERMIDTFLNDADQKSIDGELLGLISPHAGYIYSGPIAAYSYKQLVNSDVELFIVLAPSHRSRFDGASVIPEGIYETPLGNVEIESSIGLNLVKKSSFTFIKEVHQYEHSLEVQVPFIQRVVKSFKIVPIIVGTTDLDMCKKVAKDIFDALYGESRKYMVIISTDLSHYHPYDNAVTIDSRFIDSLKSFDENKIYSVCESRKAEACGEGPILAGMNLCKMFGAKRAEILKYGNSGDTAGPRDQVVGYLSAAFIK